MLPVVVSPGCVPTTLRPSYGIIMVCVAAAAVVTPARRAPSASARPPAVAAVTPSPAKRPSTHVGSPSVLALPDRPAAQAAESAAEGGRQSRKVLPRAAEVAAEDPRKTSGAKTAPAVKRSSSAAGAPTAHVESEPILEPRAARPLRRLAKLSSKRGDVVHGGPSTPAPPSRPAAEAVASAVSSAVGKSSRDPAPAVEGSRKPAAAPADRAARASASTAAEIDPPPAASAPPAKKGSKLGKKRSRAPEPPPSAPTAPPAPPAPAPPVRPAGAKPARPAPRTAPPAPAPPAGARRFPAFARGPPPAPAPPAPAPPAPPAPLERRSSRRSRYLARTASKQQRCKSFTAEELAKLKRLSDMDPAERKRQLAALRRALKGAPPAVLARWSQDDARNLTRFQFLKEFIAAASSRFPVQHFIAERASLSSFVAAAVDAVAAIRAEDPTFGSMRLTEEHYRMSEKQGPRRCICCNMLRCRAPIL